MSSSLNGFKSFANGAVPAALLPKLPVNCLCNPQGAGGGGWKVSSGETDRPRLFETSGRAEPPLAFCILMFSVRADGGISCLIDGTMCGDVEDEFNEGDF
jgi:hypothetical protein